MTTEGHGKLKKLWPVWVAIGMPILLALLDAMFGPDFFFVVVWMPALMLIWAAFGLVALIQTVREIASHRWSRAAVFAVLPLVVIAAGIRFRIFIHACDYAGSLVYFVVERPSFVKKVEGTPFNGEPRLLVFNRGGMSWASQGFVYDESDEILRARQSVEWKRRAASSELSCGYGAEPFPGHFSFTRHWYVAWFPC